MKNLARFSNFNKLAYTYGHCSYAIFFFYSLRIKLKEVNTVPEVVSIWLAVRYILGIGQYWCTISSLPLFHVFNTHTHTHTQNLYLP